MDSEIIKEYLKCNGCLLISNTENKDNICYVYHQFKKESNIICPCEDCITKSICALTNCDKFIDFINRHQKYKNENDEN